MSADAADSACTAIAVSEDLDLDLDFLVPSFLLCNFPFAFADAEKKTC